MKKRVAFVVQRYGLEVNGGAELFARKLAEHTSHIYDIEVITTKAVEYTTWANEYENDTDVINGITVHRFGVVEPRDLESFAEYGSHVLNNPDSTSEQEEKWLEMQGPYSPDLVQYIEENADNYDVFVFVTYLYYITVKGLPKVKDKALFIPTAHDEAAIHLKMYKELFKMPKAIFYLTREEKDFVERIFKNADIINNGGAGGSGIDLPENICKDRFRQERNIDEYIVYAGRIDAAKGCVQLFEYFSRYKKENDSNLKLVMLGKEAIDIPESDDIISLGFVSEQDKFDIMAGAKFLVMPSEFESLSIVVLEAMALSVPVLVNGWCSVLKGHCTRSNAGLYYVSYREFECCINYMLKSPEIMAVMGNNGRRYVERNYTWDVIIDKFTAVIETV